MSSRDIIVAALVGGCALVTTFDRAHAISCLTRNIVTEQDETKYHIADRLLGEHDEIEVDDPLFGPGKTKLKRDNNRGTITFSNERKGCSGLRPKFLS